MKHRITKLFGALLSTAATIATTPAWAGETSTTIVATATAPKSDTTTFALIVTNNKSAKLARPDLRYADDDGGKYYEMFRMLGDESHVTLHTEFDRDSKRLFPDLVKIAKLPTRAEVEASITKIAAEVTEAKKKGAVDFYFVFAGHGDVDHGKGFLELADGAFTADDLDALVKRVSATRIHIVLDSCNSFFVVNSRKPGGRHFATSEEAAKSLSERWSNVGVFLSTSAEAEVYEWSELQSGIFSHAVRSGFSGAADANGDGRVSYDELRAFIGTASKDIKNPNFRPQVFARGPGGTGGASLFANGSAKGVKVTIDEAQRRLTLRDTDEIPWVDLHKEKGKSLQLTLPTRIAKGASFEETVQGATRPSERYALSESKERSDAHASLERALALADLPKSGVTSEARGPDDMFRALYQQPFGPDAFAAFQKEEPAASTAAAYGVSADDRERMRSLIDGTADQARSARLIMGGVMLGGGVLVAGAGLYGATRKLSDYRSEGYVSGNAASTRYYQREVNSERALGYTMIGLGAAISTVGSIALLKKSAEEEIRESYIEGMNSGKSPSLVVSETEDRLLKVARSERNERHILGGVGLGVAAAGIAGGALIAIKADTVDGRTVGIAGASIYALLGATLFGSSFILRPTERMAEVWSKDPSLKRIPRTAGPTVTPQVGFGSVGLSGSF